MEGEPYFLSILAIRSLKELNFPSNVNLFGEERHRKSHFAGGHRSGVRLQPKGEAGISTSPRTATQFGTAASPFHKGPVRPKMGSSYGRNPFITWPARWMSMLPSRQGNFTRTMGEVPPPAIPWERLFLPPENRFLGQWPLPSR